MEKGFPWRRPSCVGDTLLLRRLKSGNGHRFYPTSPSPPLPLIHPPPASGKGLLLYRRCLHLNNLIVEYSAVIRSQSEIRIGIVDGTHCEYIELVRSLSSKINFYPIKIINAAWSGRVSAGHPVDCLRNLSKNYPPNVRFTPRDYRLINKKNQMVRKGVGKSTRSKRILNDRRGAPLMGAGGGWRWQVGVKVISFMFTISSLIVSSMRFDFSCRFSLKTLILGSFAPLYFYEARLAQLP